MLVARYDVARATPSVPANAVAAAAQPLNVAVAAPATAVPSVPPVPPAAASAAAPAPPDARPVFHSLFSDNRREPVSRFVRDLWTTNPRVAAALTGQPASAAAAPDPATAPGAPLDLFSDQPSNVKALFGEKS